MMTVEGESLDGSTDSLNDVLHISGQARSPPSSAAQKRFIVEPQVLNAALEFNESGPLGTSSSARPHSTIGGGLPPPPRPNSRKGRPPRSTPSSPATSGEHSNIIALLPNSPQSLDSSFTNAVATPGNSDVGPNVKVPRLSNILRGEPLMFSSVRRQSVVGQDEFYDDMEPSRAALNVGWSPTTRPHSGAAPPGGSMPSLHGSGSLPSSPELAASPVDGTRPARQNRYLSGLQKITKLGKAKTPSIRMLNSVDASLRSARRKSDAELDPRGSAGSKSGGGGSEDLSSRYRRMLDKSVRTAGELVKSSSSVPSSPITPSMKNTGQYEGSVRGSGAGTVGLTGSGMLGGGGTGFGFRGEGGARPGPGSAAATATTTTTTSPTQGNGSPNRGGHGISQGGPMGASPRGRGSHGRQPSEVSSRSSSSFAVRANVNAPDGSPDASSASSHDPPSSFTEPRISISSTIYPSSSNNHSFDIPRYPRASMSSDRASFIDFASPTAPDFGFNSNGNGTNTNSTSNSNHTSGIPHTAQRTNTEQTTPPPRRSNDSTQGKSPSFASSLPSGSSSIKPHLPPIILPPGPDKPPVPTTPKPDFSYRSRPGNKPSPSPSQAKKHNPLTNFAPDLDATLPPPNFSASNALSAKERAERIRTTRKLAQVFGQPPGISPVAQETHNALLPNGCIPIGGALTLNLSAGKRKYHRPAVSMSMTDDVANTTPVYDSAGAVVWPPPEGTRYVSLAGIRRHSAPLSPDDFSLMTGRKSGNSSRSQSFDLDDAAVIEVGTAEGVPDDSDESSTAESLRRHTGKGPGSPTSFIELSDEEEGNDGISELLAETPRASRGHGQPFSPLSPSTASFAESLTSDQVAEDERRRMREKLAKLHRFLGSRVPPHLVLGPLHEGTPLPPPALPPLALSSHSSPITTSKAPSPAHTRAHTPTHDNDDEETRRVKMRRRRSSSAAEFSRTWSDDIDRLKEELNEREKAINVRRAVKMEKMFGVAPPQTLYHTRAPTSSTPNIPTPPRQASPKPSPKLPAALPPFRFTTSNTTSKAKSKKRPGTSDSAKPLISDDGFLDAGQSSVYMHYRHSLNSLNDIIDRDDRESLAELHDYLTNAGELCSTGEQYDYQFSPSGSSGSSPTPVLPAPVVASPMHDDFNVSSPTTKPERRRSLPSRVSIASFSSEISMLLAPIPTEASFQQRRRRAAKLTHFFGVDYRDLMSQILDSIERGLEEESGKGTLKPDEVKDLQQKIVTLKTKRNSLSR